MRKSLLLGLSIVGVGASYAAGITEVGTDPATADPSTWRWQVNVILADQSNSGARPALAVGAHEAGGFDQGYERYSPLGLPEPRRTPTH
jgi:hypothetical protein